VNKQDQNTADHFSGKLLCDFDFVDFEHKLLVELEYTFSRFGMSAYQYLTGLARALDIIAETEDGKKLSVQWQKMLHKVDGAD
jgi:hypothetical protein